MLIKIALVIETDDTGKSYPKITSYIEPENVPLIAVCCASAHLAAIAQQNAPSGFDPIKEIVGLALAENLSSRETNNIKDGKDKAE